MKTLCSIAAGVGAVLLAGCASTTPSELINARTAYQEATLSPGANMASVDVYEAKKSLDRAEKSFADDGDSPETRDLAYIAQRKSLIARSKGNTAIAMQQSREAMAEADRVKQQQALATREQLGQTKDQLAKSQQQLESERQARASAEQRVQDALKNVKGLTAKHDERGLVVTLSGGVLFNTGKSEIIPNARKRLDGVVGALKDNSTGDITIVGHTDSTGSAEGNQVLSRQRAEAVGAYLISHGISQDRIRSQGAGSSEPIGDNKSAEGRASNRRVDIILSGVPGTETKDKSQPAPEQRP